MKLYTVCSDYGASGEGRTIQALIAYAENEEQAIEKFAKVFDPYFARGAEAQLGVVENEITKYLFSPLVLKEIKGMEGKATTGLHAEFHFNFS